MTRTRLEKKLLKDYLHSQSFVEWFQDFRGALLETLEENNDPRVIIRQFKNRMVKRGNRNVWFRRTRMAHYVKVALDLDL
ncbi:hypothetical protein ST201phi2-1p336 [Pseudomonas phage 201phi2-1]|uniref:Uncharacterized protein n=1 Tax=Pseudomonas phage 201phi2-1 TaxID=198110 RepID=B3FJJ6_BP201|nr:hypothetical protein ST201phi2-1p336 [Pseudomonas phage 201phi2-1]ABY63161.1 hypothetical protein 201phi2-1p336 [Pseudomonas phage 201phi2-1]